MKVTLNWLKKYVDFSWSPEELAEHLTMLGIEVEGVKKIGGEFEGVVVAQILASEKHPNADKLSVCRVADGKGERQIVCGAKNYNVGDKVPLALPGCTLPTPAGAQPFTIKVGKIRNIESQGMMCSAKELGMSEDAEGLLILPPGAIVGQAFAEHLGKAAGDVIYDLEITPNRPDLNSVIGIAREISARTGNPLRLPEIKLPHSSGGAQDLVNVRIEDAELCPRYTARIVRGVKIGPSPAWLKEALEKIGLRSISNVVDVTNYVMLEVGQPLHAFDYHLLHSAQGRPTIVVRRAADGEKFTTLDGQARTLSSQMLLVADETKPIALAGVMGGRNSEINEKTVDVLIESAYFNPQNIRATSKKLELRTESSYRFERGADVEICDWASQRAAQLIIETAGGQLADGVVDAYPKRFAPRQVTLRHAKVGQLLGVDVQPLDSTTFLRRLGLDVISEKPDSCTVGIPSFRVDLKREVDLIEEITRLYGIDRIPSTPPRGAIGANAYDQVHDVLAEARRLLIAVGLQEAQGQTLISAPFAGAALASQASGGQNQTASIIGLENPLSSDMDALRPSLLPGLLDSLRHNLTHKNNDVALFEIGRVFTEMNGKAQEERRVAVAITGRRNSTFWSGENREATYDAFDLKGMLETFLEQFGVRGVSYRRKDQPSALFIEAAEISLGKQSVGDMGQLIPALARSHDLRDPVFLAELNLDLLLARRNTQRSFKPLAAFPLVRRDVAMLVAETITHEQVLSVVRQGKPQNLESVELFDVFRGKNIPEGQKSVAYAFTYRHPERTLTDSEVNAAHEKLVAQFKQTLQAVIRDT